MQLTGMHLSWRPRLPCGLTVFACGLLSALSLPGAAGAAPVTLWRPVLSGTPQDGALLSTTDGVWSGTPPITFAYQWRRCDATGAACRDIVGATAPSYRLTAADVGATIRSRVTATDASGSDFRSSVASAVVRAAPPLTLRRPVVSGTPQDGVLLSTTDGVWSGTPPIAFTYQWRRCDATGAACRDIAGATAPSYRLTAADVGATIRSRVTATNAAASDFRSSVATAVVQAAPTCGDLAGGAARITRVVWIWMENKSFGDIIGNTEAPYENRLAGACGLATNYSGVAHPSLPNYIAATSGGTQGITDDLLPASHPLDVPSLFEQVTSWRSYVESMPADCLQTDADPYAARHNPAAYYTRISSECAVDDVPLGSPSAGPLADDLDAGTLPAFSLVVPDRCNDTHDCSVATGDRWLQTWVGRITESPLYRSGTTAVFLTWDEDDYSDGNRVPLIVISPYTAPGTRSDARFDHYSLLRTTEDLLGTGSHLGQAATAASMASAFGLDPGPGA